MDYVCDYCGHTWSKEDAEGYSCPLCGASCIRVSEDTE